MVLEDIVALAGSIGVATIGCSLYGYGDASGVPLPAKEYVMPITGAVATYAGIKVGLPDNEPGTAVGGLWGVGVAAVGAACYGLGYLIGYLNK